MNKGDYIDIASAKERFLGNEKMFKRFLYQLPERDLFQALEDKIKEKNAEEAFAAAHTLKGVAANLSLSAIEKPLHAVVEALRAGNMPEDADWEMLQEKYRESIELIQEVQREDAPIF